MCRYFLHRVEKYLGHILIYIPVHFYIFMGEIKVKISNHKSKDGKIHIGTYFAIKSIFYYTRVRDPRITVVPKHLVCRQTLPLDNHNTQKIEK